MNYGFHFIAVTLSSLFLLANTNGITGKRTTEKTECSIVNGSMPSIYITFEPSEPAEKSLHWAFHNNLSCPVTVETQDINPAQFGSLFQTKGFKDR